MLTIAIPTYNRNETLLTNLHNLLPQLSHECNLLIIDNCSDVPVAETLAEPLEYSSEAKVRVIRNQTNIGANANILRCFEMCDTEWLWVLGDDDEVKPDAVEIILQYVMSYPDCLFFDFSSDMYHHDRMVLTRGVEEFVERIESFANTLFISAGVYKASALRPNLKFGYAYTYSCAPHFVTLLVSLGEEGRCCLSKAQIVSWAPPPVEQHWSHVNYSLGIMTILELPLPGQARKTLSARLLRIHPSLRYLIANLLIMAKNSGDHQYALYLYDQMCYRLYYFDMKIGQRINIGLGRLVLRFPHIGYVLFQLIYKLIKGKSVSGLFVPKRFDRL